MVKPLSIARHEDRELALLPALANRHGLITGATGTGKTVTLQVLAERFSEIGVPVFMADVKVQHTVPIADGDTSYGANYVTSIDPAGETLAQRLARRLHIRHTDAQRLAAGLHRGSLVVTVETTEAAAASIRRLLRAAGAHIVTTEEVAGRLTPLAS